MLTVVQHRRLLTINELDNKLVQNPIFPLVSGFGGWDFKVVEKLLDNRIQSEDSPECEALLLNWPARHTDIWYAKRPPLQDLLSCNNYPPSLLFT